MLRNAHLQGAKLFNTHLRFTVIEGAHLEGASLDWVSGLTQTQINFAIGDERTALPEGLTRPAHRTKSGAEEGGPHPESRP